MSSRVMIIGFCTVLLLSGSARWSAQGQSVVLAPGVRIRVFVANNNRTQILVGELVSASPESLIYRDTKTRAIAAVGRDSIVMVEHGLLDGHHTVDGAALGFLGGLVIGGFAGYGAARSGCSASTAECLQGPWLLLGSGVGGVIGLMVGAVVGRNTDAARWERAELPQRIGLAPLFEPHSTLGLSLHFTY